MAIVRIVVTATTTAARAAFTSMQSSFLRLAAQARVASSRMVSSVIARGGIFAVMRQGFAALPGLARRGFAGVGSMAARATRAVVSSVGSMTSQLLSQLTKFGPQMAVVGATLGAALGAGLAGALAATVSAAVIVGGIVAAIKGNAALGGVWSDIFGTMGSDVKRSAQVLVEPLLKAADFVKERWGKVIGPGLAQAFANVAPQLERLLGSIVGMVENILPGLLKLTAGSAGPLRAMGEMFMQLGSAVSGFFDSLSQGGDGAVKGIMALTMILTGTLLVLGKTLQYTAMWFDGLTEAAEAWGKALGRIWPPAKAVGDAIGEFNDDARTTSEITPLFTKGLEAVGYASKQAAQAAAELNEQMDVMFRDMTNGVDAALRYEEAIDALATSVAENGRATDISTAAGRENVRAVEDIARAAWQAREAAIAMAGGQNASKDAVNAANATFQQQIGALRAMLTQMGFTKAQVDQLIGAWQNLAAQPNINKTVTTTYTYRGALSDAVAPRGPGGPRYNASGGHPRGLSWVGENGRELVDFGAQGRVFNHGQSERMAGVQGPNGRRTWDYTGPDDPYVTDLVSGGRIPIPAGMLEDEAADWLQRQGILNSDNQLSRYDPPSRAGEVSTGSAGIGRSLAGLFRWAIDGGYVKLRADSSGRVRVA